MKLLYSSILLIALSLTCLAQEVVPTPLKSLSIDFDKDGEKWEMKNKAGNRDKILVEFTPKGQSIQKWDEMVAHEITFTKETLKEYYSRWKRMVLSADPKVVIKEVGFSDENIIVLYQSALFNEYTMRRFIKAEDGVYALAYHSRVTTHDKERFLIWTKIICSSKLVANPLKNRDNKSQ